MICNSTQTFMLVLLRCWLSKIFQACMIITSIELLYLLIPVLMILTYISVTGSSVLVTLVKFQGHSDGVRMITDMFSALAETLMLVYCQLLKLYMMVTSIKL